MQILDPFDLFLHLQGVLPYLIKAYALKKESYFLDDNIIAWRTMEALANSLNAQHFWFTTIDYGYHFI